VESAPIRKEEEPTSGLRAGAVGAQATSGISLPVVEEIVTHQ
jgi:hypothetical protein